MSVWWGRALISTCESAVSVEMGACRFPSLASLGATLPTGGNARPSVQELRKDWWAACGSRNGPPTWPEWESVGGRGKQQSLHQLAESAASEVGKSGPTPLSPYDRTPIAELATDRAARSVEHVLPRSRVNGSAGGRAENDPNAWVVASRTANASRGNLPLVLWDHPDMKTVDSKRVFINGEPHYCPPLVSRARLARVWVYTRATYGSIDSIDSPSAAQRENWDNIMSIMQNNPPDKYEVSLANTRRSSPRRWANPLSTTTASAWLDDARVSDLETLVFS